MASSFKNARGTNVHLGGDVGVRVPTMFTSHAYSLRCILDSFLFGKPSYYSDKVFRFLKVKFRIFWAAGSLINTWACIPFRASWAGEAPGGGFCYARRDPGPGLLDQEETFHRLFSLSRNSCIQCPLDFMEATPLFGWDLIPLHPRL